MSKPRILVTRRLQQEVLNRLFDAFQVQVYEEDQPMPRDLFLKQIKGMDGVLSTPSDQINEEALTAAGPTLRIIANSAVEYDNFDVAVATQKGVFLTNTPNQTAFRACENLEDVLLHGQIPRDVLNIEAKNSLLKRI